LAVPNEVEQGFHVLKIHSDTPNSLSRSQLRVSTRPREALGIFHLDEANEPITQYYGHHFIALTHSTPMSKIPLFIMG